MGVTFRSKCTRESSPSKTQSRRSLTCDLTGRLKGKRVGISHRPSTDLTARARQRKSQEVADDAGVDIVATLSDYNVMRCVKCVEPNEQGRVYPMSFTLTLTLWFHQQHKNVDHCEPELLQPHQQWFLVEFCHRVCPSASIWKTL